MRASKGHLVLVTGPSGAGKDSVLNAAKVALAGDRGMVFPRRFVTRLSHVASEDHVAMTEMEFAIAAADGAFALWWRAHGNFYGIGSSIMGDLEAGSVVAVNCSRTAVAEAMRRFANVTVVDVTAPSEVLVGRIVARGRESAEQALARVSREVPDYPPGARVVAILNDGPLERAVALFCAVLAGLKDTGAHPGGSPLDGQHQQEDRKDDGRGLIIVEHL